MKPLTLLLLSTLAINCSSIIPKAPKPTKDTSYKINFEATGWEKTDPRESDFAWVQSKTGEVIVVNSFCGEFQSLPLESLALKTFDSYDSFKPLGKNTLEWNEREAFEMEAEAKIDGVVVLLNFRNYRRDHCYYDFLLVTPRQRNPKSYQTFKELMTKVSFK